MTLMDLWAVQAFAVTGTLEANVPVVTKEEFFRLDPEHLTRYDQLPIGPFLLAVCHCILNARSQIAK